VIGVQGDVMLAQPAEQRGWIAELVNVHDARYAVVGGAVRASAGRTALRCSRRRH
jgi:hypothetical protein